MAGAGLHETARILNLPYGPLSIFSRKHFWTERRTMARRHANTAITANLEARIQQARIDHQKFMLRELEKNEDIIEGMEAQVDPKAEVTVERKMGLLEKHDTMARRTLGIDKEQADPIQAGFAMLAAMSQAAQEQSKITHLVNERPDSIEGGELDKCDGIESDINELNPLNNLQAMVVQREGDSDASTGILGSANGVSEGGLDAKNDLDTQNGKTGQ